MCSFVKILCAGIVNKPEQFVISHFFLLDCIPIFEFRGIMKVFL